MTLFTGSSRVAEKLAANLKGRVKLEDAGFDWKILGPDVQEVSAEMITSSLASFHIFQQFELRNEYLSHLSSMAG